MGPLSQHSTRCLCWSSIPPCSRRSPFLSALSDQNKIIPALYLALQSTEDNQEPPSASRAMRKMKGHSGIAATAAAVLHYATTISALASTSTGSNDDIRFQWGIPEAVASSGSGNVYFQLEAPVSYAWVGLGTGSQMRGSQRAQVMFCPSILSKATRSSW